MKPSAPRAVIRVATPGRRVRGRRAAGEIRDAILEAARGLYARGGYAAVTIRALAEQMGLKPSSLYHHFTSKEQIFVALQERGLELLVSFQDQPPAVDDPIEDLRRFYWRFYEFSQKQADYFALVYLDRSAPDFDIGLNAESTMLQRLAAGTRARIQRCVAAGVFPRRTDADRVGAILLTAVHGAAALQMVHHRHLPDVDLIAAESLDLAIEGIRTGGLPKIAAKARKRLRKGGVIRIASTN